jgi:hypothetical protein
MAGQDDYLVSRLRARAADPARRTDCPTHAPGELYPPASPQALTAAERALGFRLPGLLRRMYLEVGNGGFGSGYGLMGVEGGAKAGLRRSVVQLYLDNRLAGARDSSWSWPEKLVPICHYGCCITSCIDCTQQKTPVVYNDPNSTGGGSSWGLFQVESRSLADWFEDWLDGLSLQERLSQAAE